MLPGTGVREVSLPAGVTVGQAVVRYQRSSAVRFAEPDYLLRASSQTEPLHPNDPGYPYLYGMHNTGQDGGTADADIDAPEAWRLATGSADTVLAVIDTGVAVGHPDLADNVWTNPGEVPGNNIDDDNNGYVDDVHGWDFYHDDNTLAHGSEDDHGTHVAGTIAATGSNGIGVTGVNWRARIMALKFLGPDGGGYTSDAIEALGYAIANRALISNNSWGGPWYSQALRDAISRAQDAGHLFVAAAGNGGSDGVGDDNDVAPDYPASYPEENIVAVAATDRDDELAGFSNYGESSVDLAAPGVDIVSTLPGNAYGYFSGTSMAAPHVTGAAALLHSHQPRLGMRELKARLLETTDPQPSLQPTVTGGRLNLARALASTTASTLSLANDPATVRFGQHTTLSGRLAADGQGLEGRTVVLQQRPVGSIRWSRVSDGVRTTAPYGTYGLAGVSPRKHTDYRARYAGDPDTEPSMSPVLRTNVRVKVSLAVLGRDLKLGRSRVISGSVRPAHNGTVRLVIRRNGTVIARQTLPLTDSRYRFSYQPPRRGTYRFTTLRYADEDHLNGRSRTKGFRVVR